MNPLMATVRAWPRTTVWVLVTVLCGVTALLVQVYR